MCISPLSIEDLETLKNFQYKSDDKSLVYNYVISPILNKIVQKIPPYIAPNVLTLFSLICNIISVIVTTCEAGNSNGKELSRTVCVIQFIAHFLYILLDNLDGKQARRTGTSSPYGMLLDHGCDIFTTIIVCYNMTHLLLLGNEGPFCFLFFYALIPAFYLFTYEEYVLGQFNMGYLNGIDEGNVIIALCSLFGAIFSSKIYSYTIWEFSLGQWIALLTFIASMYCVLASFFTVCMSKGFIRFLRELVDFSVMYTVIIYPIVLSILDRNFFEDYFWLIMLVVSLIFARHTMELQVKICIKKNLSIGIIMILVNVALYSTLILEMLRKEVLLLNIIAFCTIALGIEVLVFAFVRSNEILTFLKLRLLCVQVNRPLC